MCGQEQKIVLLYSFIKVSNHNFNKYLIEDMSVNFLDVSAPRCILVIIPDSSCQYVIRRYGISSKKTNATSGIRQKSSEAHGTIDSNSSESIS